MWWMYSGTGPSTARPRAAFAPAPDSWTHAHLWGAKGGADVPPTCAASRTNNLCCV
jgi:hypothetical protein